MNNSFKNSDNDKSGWRFVSLGRSLLLWFLLLALLPLSLNAWFAYREMTERLTAAATHELEIGAAQKAKFIKSWFKYRFLDIEGQSEGSQNIEFLAALQQGLKSSQQRPEEFVKSYAWARLVSERQQDLQTFVKRYDYLSDLLLIDVKGNILYTVQQNEDFGDNVFTGLYAGSDFDRIARKSMSDGQILFSDFRDYGFGDDHLIGFISAPVLSEGGEIIGMIAFQVSLVRIKQLTLGEREKNSIVHYLVGRDGLARTPVRNMQMTGRQSQRISTEQFALWLLHIQDKVEHTDAAKQTAFEYKGPAGQVVIGLHQSVKLPGVDWALISEIDRDEVVAGANKVGQITLMIFILSSIVTALLASFLAKRITRPIVQLADASNKISAGEMDQRVEIVANNEIGVMARSFNEMMDTRARYEDALKESNQVAQQAFVELEEQKLALDEHAIVAITDIKGNITFANEKFSEISGYSNEELIGQNHRLLNSGKHSLEFFKDMYRVIASGEVWHAEICNRAKGGRFYWVDTTIVPFKDEKGKPKSYIAIRADITEQKANQAEIIKAKETAEVATQLKSDFLANMSHEIRTPMNGVIGMTSLLLDTDLQPRQRNYVENALSSADSLLVIINDILDFSKIEAGKLELESIPFDLQILAEEVVEMMSIKCQEKDIELLLRFLPGTERFLVGDPGRVRQILLNLLSNAIKFTEKGCILLTVESLEIIGKEVTLFIKVEDTGIGISKEKLEVVFNKFDQEDGSTTRRYGGTGLGLSICRQLCELMQGEIQVGSQKGFGSTFSFHIVLGLGEEKNIPLSEESAEHLLKDVKALVVDDMAIARMIMTEYLSATDLRVETASSGSQALEMLKIAIIDKEPFEVVITDFNMPEMDGEMLAETIREQKLLEDGALIFMTSSPRKGDGHRLTKLGFDGYLTKPTFPSEVAQILSLVWGAKQHGEKIPLVSRHTLGEAKAKSRKKIKFTNVHILLVEDNPVNQIVATEYLEGYGIHAVPAGNGLEALALLKEQEFDLILMDCQMPKMDGYEATEAIRQIESKGEGKHIPIVAFTANAMKKDKDKCLACGMDDFIPKPVVREVLENILTKWLPNKSIEEIPEKDILFSREPKNISDIVEVIDDMSDASILLDESVLTDLEFLLGEKFTIILDQYFATTKKNIAIAQKAVEDIDLEVIGRVMHQLKSSSRQFGAFRLGEIAEQIEVSASEKDSANIEKIFPFFLEMHKKVEGLIEQRLKSAQYVDSSIQTMGVWDKADVLARVGGKEKGLHKLLHLFIEDMPERMENLQQTIENNQPAESAMIAHAIKEASVNISGKLVQQISAEMQLSGEESDTTQLKVLWPKLYTQYQVLIECLIRELNDPSANTPVSVATDNVTTLPMLAEQLQQIFLGLQQGDYVDPQAVTALEPLFPETNRADLFKLNKQVSSFDADGAIETVKKLADSQEITLSDENQYLRDV